MSNDLKNILSNLNKDVEQDKLLEYLNHSLSQSETHKVEAALNDDPFLNDAVEGLQEFTTISGMNETVEALNENLYKQTHSKGKRKTRRYFDEQSWIPVTVLVILLLLCIIAYFIVRHLKS